nr:hypothetical protein CFP56_23161 [Quercus suber]
MFTPSTTRSKGKSKVGKSVWEDPTTALESNFVLFFQVFGESLRLTTDYFSTEEKIVAANSKSQAVDFSNLFEAIDTEVLADEAKEQGEATAATVGGDGATKGGPTDEARVDEGHVDEVIAAP